MHRRPWSARVRISGTVRSARTTRIQRTVWPTVGSAWFSGLSRRTRLRRPISRGAAYGSLSARATFCHSAPLLGSARAALVNAAFCHALCRARSGFLSANELERMAQQLARQARVQGQSWVADGGVHWTMRRALERIVRQLVWRSQAGIAELVRRGSAGRLGPARVEAVTGAGRSRRRAEAVDVREMLAIRRMSRRAT